MLLRFHCFEAQGIFQDMFCLVHLVHLPLVFVCVTFFWPRGVVPPPHFLIFCLA